MTNPFDPTYLMTASADFGLYAWAFFAIQIVGFIGGLYLVFARPDSNVTRKVLLQWLGTALVVVGGIGIMLGALRLSAIAPFTQRYWFAILLLAEILLAGYVSYYARAIYPKKLAESHTSRGKARSRPAATREAPATAKPRANDRPASASASAESATTAARSGRRDSRQRRKRKQRQ